MCGQAKRSIVCLFFSSIILDTAGIVIILMANCLMDPCRPCHCEFIIFLMELVVMAFTFKREKNKNEEPIKTARNA